MEYLMTYGWAILIIAVVLGALFGLGFFNSANLAPKVSAGSCQVQRPQGPGTTSYINLEGTCNNELPQYAAEFNGATSYISFGTQNIIGTGAYTISFWIYNQSSSPGGLFTLVYGTGGGLFGRVYMGSIEIGTGELSRGIFGSVPTGAWKYIVFVSDGQTYINGVSQSVQLGFFSGCGVDCYGTATDNYIGYDIGNINPSFLGSIANFQIYNASLSANEILAMYQEGIGGAPINLQNLVGWWPLNGDANDYSGNLNNGVPTNVIFTTSWTNGYSAP